MLPQASDRHDDAPAETDEPLEALDSPLPVHLNHLSDALFVIERLVDTCPGVPEETPTYCWQLIAAGLGYRYTADR